MRDTARVAAVAFLGVFGAAVWYEIASNPSRTPTVRVYVAKAAAAEGAAIEDPAELFAIRELSVNDCRKGAVQAGAEDIRGRRMRRTLQAGEALSHDDLVPLAGIL